MIKGDARFLFWGYPYFSVSNNIKFSHIFFVSGGKQIIKFNGHRQQYNQNFRLIMVNRLYNFKIPKEFYSLCTVLDLRPTQHLLCSDVQQISLDLMSPRVRQYLHHILYSGLMIVRQLDSINGNLMHEIQRCQGSHEMWNNTEKLQNLAQKRKEVRTVRSEAGVETVPIESLL